MPSSHPAYAAVQFLYGQEIMQGYPDGTFKPEKILARSEALKVIVASKLSPEEIAQYTGTNYDDVTSAAWYYPFVQAGFQKLHIIDGPPKTSLFNGARNVNKVEFLKMFFLAQGVDTNGAYGEVQLPFSNDVTDPTAWYYPHVRYALSATMILVDTNGNLLPSQELTRGEVAIMLHRYAMYVADRRAQAGLKAAEDDLVNVLVMLEKNELIQAEYASARALIIARGVHASRPDTAIVRGALKISEAFRALVRGYRAGIEGNLGETDGVIARAKEAFALSESAKALSPSLTELSGRVQEIAKKMADEARALQEAPKP